VSARGLGKAARRRPSIAGGFATWVAVAVLGMSGAALPGCDLTGSDDEDTAATTPTTTETDAKAPTGPSGQNGGGGGGGDDQTPADTGPTVPESGGVGGDEYDPEQDAPGHDIPPPPGSPQEQFEQECAENPGIC
jgi:hypothetical protein